MVNCSGCGRAVEGGEAINIGIEEKVFHLSCAPDQLVDDALEEWSAIVKRGVTYFVGKYQPPNARPSGYSNLDSPKDGPSSYIKLFAAVGEALRTETTKRKG